MSLPPRPKSKFEDENGLVNIGLLMALDKDYPEVYEWDKMYAEECDRLSELAAIQAGKRHWGRWVLNTTRPFSLDCIEVRPAVDDSPQRKFSPYEIVLSRIGPGGESDGSAYTWQEHMAEKNWMGTKGLEDFKKAVSEIYQTHPEWLRRPRKSQENKKITVDVTPDSLKANCK